MNLRLKIAEIICTVFYIGKLPIAPGTFGSLAAFLCWYIIKPGISDPVFLLISGAFCCLPGAKAIFGQLCAVLGHFGAPSGP